ncbi:MAG: hypothetical protein AAF598_11505, partial [Bacteroidota bacterium]
MKQRLKEEGRRKKASFFEHAQKVRLTLFTSPSTFFLATAKPKNIERKSAAVLLICAGVLFNLT